ncbi:MAG: DUF1549 domain-containing protein [Opitutia bacterium]|jgi:hypothetical protein
MRLHLLALAPLAAVAAPVDFAHEVIPVLRKHCAECHTGEKKKGGLSMNTLAELLEGGENGPVLVPGKPADSKLLAVVVADPDSEERMPPKGKGLDAREADLLRRWVAEGAPWTPGFAFKAPAYEPPLRPRRPTLPEASRGRVHPVDRVVDAWLGARKLPLPAAAEDSAFLRRAHLDLVGILPTAEEARAFLADSSPDKRERLVRSLLARDVDYADHWMSFWNDLLRNDYAGTGYIDGGRRQVTQWLHRSLLENRSYDRMVRELVNPVPGSEGFASGILWRGSVSVAQGRELQYSQSVSQVLLGINMKCASCHDSFTDRWKLRDAYGLAAIFGEKPLELVRCDIPTGRTAVAAWPFPELGQVDPAAPRPERLRQLAELMVHPDNGRLRRTVANRLWHRLMGRGLVHPVDAMETPPWSEELLDVLANRLADNGHDLRDLLAFIATSQAYGARAEVLDPRSADSAAYVYRGPRARRLTAEQFVDALWRLTGTGPDKVDADVARLAPGAAEPRLAAKAIWSDDTPAGALPAAGESRVLRRRFELASAPSRALAAVTCDNAFELVVNGRSLGSGGEWWEPRVVDLAPHLRAGANEIILLARNAGTGPNGAAAWLQAHLVLPGGATLTLVTDAGWEWSQKGEAGAAWRPVRVFADTAGWERGERALAAQLAEVHGTPRASARASLVKADLLQRSLGRPNREQIVSERPNELSTLEAIDLSNGPALSALLARGSRNLLARGWKSPAELVDWLWLSALCRPPSETERRVALGLLGEQPSEQSVADLVWSVLMLPEFATVR